ncbi:MAG: tRNA methyl transferase PRC-barrel domain-containing protein, partial [Alphaproteobacteria bacterium]
RPEAARAGDSVDMEGRVLGRHEGTIGFTVGQRRGLGIGGSAEPLYVVAVDPAAARVVVGPRAALARREIRGGAVNRFGGAARAARARTSATRATSPRASASRTTSSTTRAASARR